MPCRVQPFHGSVGEHGTPFFGSFEGGGKNAKRSASKTLSFDPLNLLGLRCIWQCVLQQLEERCCRRVALPCPPFIVVKDEVLFGVPFVLLLGALISSPEFQTKRLFGEKAAHRKEAPACQ